MPIHPTCILMYNYKEGHGKEMNNKVRHASMKEEAYRV